MKKKLISIMLAAFFAAVLTAPLQAGEIHLASQQGNVKKVELFLKDNPELLNVGDMREGRTPLHWAALGGSVDVVTLLITSGAQVHARDKDGQMPIHTASTVDVAGLLINKGADISAKDNYGRTPLHYAAYYGNDRLVEFLLDKGMQLNLTDEELNTPLLLAIDNGKQKTALLLISRGAPVNSVNRDGNTPLKVAKKKGQKEVVEALQKKEARE